MKQYLSAIAASALLVASCTIAPTPVSLERTTLQLSMSGLLPSQRQLQYLLPGAKARVTVAGVGLAEPLVQVAPISGETSAITLTGVPTGPNRVVTVETLDEAEQPIPGGRFRTSLTLVSGSNAAVLSAASSVRGDVFDDLLAAKSDLARTLDATRLQEKIDAIKEAQRVAHYGLIDGGAIAARLQQNGGQVEALDVSSAALVQTPTRLQVKVSGLPDGLQATVWVTDPVSPKQTGVGNGTFTLQPIKPGTWQLYGRAGSLSLGPVAVNLSASGATTLDFSRSQVLSQALPEGRGGAASGIVSVGGQDRLVVAGGTVTDKGINSATDSVLVFDGTTWTAKARMPKAVSHPGYATHGSLLYVLGGQAPDGVTGMVQVYDAAADAWSTSLPALPYASYLVGAARIGDVLYVTSGQYMDGSEEATDWYIYKLPLTGSSSWTSYGGGEGDPELRFSRFGSAVAAEGGKLYVFGGAYDDGTLMHRVEVYDPAKSTVREVAPMPTARHGAFAWAKAGKIYVMGGINDMGKALSNVEVYDVASDAWSVMPPLREPRGHAAVGELGGRLVVAGGNDGYYAYQSFLPITVRQSVESLAF